MSLRPLTFQLQDKKYRHFFSLSLSFFYLFIFSPPLTRVLDILANAREILQGIFIYSGMCFYCITPLAMTRHMPDSKVPLLREFSSSKRYNFLANQLYLFLLV
jgi:hypothetical protein